MNINALNSLFITAHQLMHAVIRLSNHVVVPMRCINSSIRTNGECCIVYTSNPASKKLKIGSKWCTVIAKAIKKQIESLLILLLCCILVSSFAEQRSSQTLQSPLTRSTCSYCRLYKDPPLRPIRNYFLSKQFVFLFNSSLFPLISFIFRLSGRPCPNRQRRQKEKTHT